VTFHAALSEYVEHIARVTEVLQGRAGPEREVTSTFDSDAWGQRWRVPLPGGSHFTLVVTKSAFEVHSPETLAARAQGMPLSPGGEMVLTDSNP